MHSFLPVYAQAAAAQGSSGMWVMVIQFGAIFAIFYFLMIRPQQKQRKALEESILALHKGDNVVTTGGVVGEVVHIKESIDDGKPSKGMDDLVTIRTGEVKIVVERRAIARVAAAGSTAAA